MGNTVQSTRCNGAGENTDVVELLSRTPGLLLGDTLSANAVICGLVIVAVPKIRLCFVSILGP